MRSGKAQTALVLGDLESDPQTLDADLSLPTKDIGTPQPLAFLPPDFGTMNGKPVLTWDQAAAQITRDNVSWGAAIGDPAVVTYSFRSSAPTMPEGTTGFQRFNAAQISYAEEALSLWAEAANITFVRVGTGVGDAAYSNDATIVFGNYTNAPFQASAFAYLPEAGESGPGFNAGDVWVDASDWYNMTPSLGGFGPHVLTHEIGHAIGLNHPGDYNGYVGGVPTYVHDAEYYQDSRMFTVMSYFPVEATDGDAPFGIGPQLHDIAAVQRLYGVNTTTRTGDTIYGFNSNAGHARYTISGEYQMRSFSIWDGGGNDTLDLSGYNVSAEIDLREESFTSAGYGPGGYARHNISIARGVVIENAIGGSGNDAMIGNDADNVMTGNGGADVIGGGNGFDTASYLGSNAGVTIDLALGTAIGGHAQNDLLVSIEALTGSAFADTLHGDANANTLRGEGGDDTLVGAGGADLLQGGDGADTLIGGAGADTLAGGAGVDTVNYSASAAGVTIDLNSGTGAGGDAAGDVLGSIEIVIGTAQNDLLIGRDFFANTLNGGAGDDTLIGRYGADNLIGGDGVDLIDYSNSLTGVDIRLFQGSAAGGEANGDTYSGIENVRGSATATDTLAGDDGVNFIWGGGGNETITGRGGADHLFGDAGNDTLLGGAADDILAGGLGNDTLGGGAGDDTADYSASNAGVIVNLATGAGSGGHAQGDTLVSIEDVIGSAFDDVIIGKANAWDNVFDGGGGNDTVTGGQGADTFVFRNGDGSDIITDFAGPDFIRMTAWGASFDTFAEVIAAASQNGADVVFDFGNGQSLTLQNVTLGNLNAGDFLFA